MSEHAPDPKRCTMCRGSGLVGLVTCSECHGSGRPRRIVSRDIRIAPVVTPEVNGDN